MAVYFTKLKTLWDELVNFRPACTCGKCDCGGVRLLESFNHQEHVMLFLLGLNDSFSQIRGQLLLTDPLPPINKVFSLVTQEERQRIVSSNSNHACLWPLQLNHNHSSLFLMVKIKI